MAPCVVLSKISDVERDKAYESIEHFAEAVMQVKQNYVEEKSYEEIVNAAILGMLKSLDDHSSFLDKAAYGEMQEDTTGKFGGLGIRVGIRHTLVTVIAPIEDTPAFNAGMQAGDIIVEIDGHKTRGMSLKDAIELMRGDKGTKVTLKVRRDGDENLLAFEIERADIKVPTVKGASLLRDGVGYVRLTTFARNTAVELKESIDELIDDGMDALVLDLRNNPGGLLTAAVDVSELFLDKGDVVVSTRGRQGPGISRRADGETHYLDIPMTVLVNGGSASASEIVAGALQDHRRAVLVGDTTFGKGSVQSVIPMLSAEGAALRITTSRYYTPSGRQIHEKGLDPDIPVYLTKKEWMEVLVHRLHEENPEYYDDSQKEQFKDAVDHQLNRAIDILLGLKIFAAK